MFKTFSRAQGSLKSPFYISSIRAYLTVFKSMIDSLKFTTFMTSVIYKKLTTKFSIYIKEICICSELLRC